jgi:hypothetical protein
MSTEKQLSNADYPRGGRKENFFFERTIVDRK